jgi:hypothetical protein
LLIFQFSALCYVIFVYLYSVLHSQCYPCLWIVHFVIASSAFSIVSIQALYKHKYVTLNEFEMYQYLLCKLEKYPKETMYVEAYSFQIALF